ncbi:MAG TPA: LytTR family DNA-binding domain-containing protein [Candidatus Kapabacteria bacterium]|nr:LytTR family DNA-binding domain-containing protein [Candidatus Kapabacteria bacterium]
MTHSSEMNAPPSVAPTRIVLADDEPLGRKRLLDLLATTPDVDVVAVATNGREAIEAVLSHAPDVVLLDVHMPDVSGIEVVRSVGISRMPPTVFITAYDRHAIEAFELAAVDYLLKPFDDDRFRAALERARDAALLRRIGPAREALARLIDAGGAEAPNDPEPAPHAGYLQRIAVEVRGQHRFLPVAQVEHITADGPYAHIHTVDGRHVIRERMSTLEQQLDPAVFLRIHRSIIVRLELVDALSVSGGGDYSVRLRDGTRLKVARGKREELVRRLKGTQSL